ncbi:MAG: ABC transporter ATP-binding protein [Patescibacteria group bacterium]
MHRVKSKNQSIPHKPLRYGLFVTRPFALWAVLSIVFVVLAQGLETSTYYVFKKLIDTAELFSSGQDATNMLMVWIIIYPIAAVGHSLMYRASGLTAMRWVTGVQKYGRDALFAYLVKHSHTYFSNKFAGALGNKIWNAADGVGDLIENFLWSGVNVVVAFLGSLLLVFLASPTLALVYSFWMVILIVVSYFLSRRNSGLSEQHSKERTHVSGLTVDVLSNITALRQYVMCTAEIVRAEGATKALRDAALRAWFGREVLLIISNVVMGMFVVSMLYGSFSLWRGGSMTTGSFIMILTLMSGLAGWFSQIGNSMNAFARGYGLIKEGLEEILLPHDITDFPKAPALAVSDGAIVFNKVTFLYGTQPVFSDFSISLEGGKRVGLVGPSGSGKTTFVSLLLRQQDVHEGEICIDGQNLRKVTQDSLNAAISVVPQESVLFHRTLRENIAYGKPDATDEEIFEAARKAQAHEFIMMLPEGYGTLVGERGVKLSGGQRQRVAIARAILKAAPILILDEATSSLDSESEVEIQKALHELMQGKTVIAIAHRLSTIREMDRILVLDGGTIVQDGSHDELVKDEHGVYARLWNHQAGGFLPD